MDIVCCERAKERGKAMLKRSVMLVFALVVGGLAAFVFMGCSTGISPSSIDGYWMVESEATSEDQSESEGIFTVYQFEGENTFRLIAHLYDSDPFVREGTYEIKNGKVYVSIPALEDMQVGGITYSGAAVENGEVSINNDTLTTTAIAADGTQTTAKKITDEQYQEAVDAAAALGPQKIAIGETITTPTANFTVNSMSFVDEIYPSDMSGYYTYMTKQDGKSYLLAKVTYTNPATEYEVPGYATQASFSVDGNTYSANVEVDAGTRFGAMYRVEAKETATIYIYGLVPDSVKELGNVKLTWCIPSEQSYMTAYYRSSFPQDKFTVTM